MDEYRALIEINNLRASDFAGDRTSTIENYVYEVMESRDIVFSFNEDKSIDSVVEVPLTDVPLVVKITFLANETLLYEEKVKKGIFEELKCIFKDRTRNPLVLPVLC